MRTHSWLSTPPGSKPVELVGPDGETELYVPGVALPSEPRVAGRYRKLILAGLGLALVVIVAIVAWSIITSGQTFDPALDQQPGQIDPATEQDPTLQVPDGAGG